MASQSAPIQEVSRLLDLVPFLSTHSHISLKELANEFGITEKAMANELTALSMCGLPGYTPYELIEIFFESGFVTINNHDALDIPRALTQLEVASLLIGLEILRDAAIDETTGILEKIDSLIEQLKSLLGGAIAVLDNPLTSFQAVIEGAIARRRTLSLEYRSPVRDEVSTRNVDPLSLRSESNHLYLVAFCHSAQAVREFRLDRVIEVKAIEDSSFTPRSLTSESGEQTCFQLKVSGDRRAISEALSISDIAPDGKTEVEVYSPEWMNKAVLAHAPYIELLGAGERRGEIKRLAENILALYSS
jgi:proteasome accessory factor C